MPAVTENTMVDSKGEVVTDFIDSVGTSSVSYTYTNTQTSLYIRNDSDVSITVTVNGSPTTVTRLSDTTITAEFTSFSIVSASGIASFYARSLRGVPTNTTSTSQLNVISGTAASPSITAIADANTGIFFPASETIAFSTNGSERVRVNSSGNVGIGTTSPAGRLTLRGASGTSGKNQGILIEYSNGTEFGAFGLNDSTGWPQLMARAGAGLTFHTNSDLLTSGEVMRITSAGNVGIGTTSPTNIFSVVSATGQTGLNAGTVSSPVKGNLWYDTDGSGWKFQIGKWQSSAFTAQMTFQDNGNVGIGTTSPSVKFHIAGSTGVGMLIQDTTLSKTAYLTHETGKFQINANQAINFAESGTSTTMYLTGGNVGIGTTSPSYNLEVSRSSDPSIGTYTPVSSSAGVGALFFDGNDSGGTRRNYALLQGAITSGTAGSYSGQINFFTANNGTIGQKMILTGAGHVGIGTTSPDTVTTNTKVLHVEGQNYGVILTSSITNAVKGQFIADGSGPWVGFGSRTNHSVLFTTNDVSRLVIESGGTTRPAANNTYDLGSSSFRWSTIYAQNALNTSDARLKTDVTPSSLGLDFINQLNPVQYRWIEGGNTVEKVQTGTETVEITPAIPAQPEVLDEDGNMIQEATQEVPAVTEERPVFETVVTPREGVRTHFGLIAQEVKAALPDGLDFAGWCLADKDDPNSTQSLGYTQLIAPMIKAIQELTAKVEALEAQLNGN